MAVTTGVQSSSLIEDFHLLSYESLDSTNSEARRLAEGGGAHGAFIWARQQSSGRGRMGREWISHEGNLFVSVLLAPGVDLAKLSQLSFVAALACGDSLRPLVGNDVTISYKWPNDILLDGKKVGGILLESFETREEDGQRRWVVVGVGVNIESAPDDVAYPCTFIKDAGVELVSAKIILSRFIHHFIEWYEVWRNKGFAPIRKEWTGRCEGLGKSIDVRLPTETLSGIFDGLDSKGNLLLTENGQRQTITAGDVFFR